MMVKGVGTDLVEVARIERSLAKHGGRFAERILSAKEYSGYKESKKPADYVAKRFAVKEAVSKALGTGFSAGITLKDIELEHLESGQPYAVLHGKAKAKMEEFGAEGVYISLSDEAGLVSAFAVLG
ncbi:MAG: holo-[acyl-carrier protein] synthase [Oleiphilaceae bacterium]|jgi:holo-[acyl-carrier protein] synthase